jgi:hypothetical protein
VADRLGAEVVAADPLEAQVVVDSLEPEVAVYSAAVAGQVDTGAWDPPAAGQVDTAVWDPPAAGQVDTAVWEPPAAISPDQAPACALVRPADPRLRLQDVAARMQLQKLAITEAS